MPTPPWFPVTPRTDKTNEILIMGQRFELASADIDVRTYDMEGAYNFYGADSPDGMPMFGYRYEKPGLKVTTIEQLFEQVHQMVIHTDIAQDGAACFRALTARSLSSHFVIDWDGVLWQMLDIMDCGYHAGEANNKSIGLDMNNNGQWDEGIDANIFAYFGPVETGFHQPTSDQWENTGNLIGTPENRWDLNQIGSTRYYDDYATALSMAGNKKILYIYLVIDSGWLFGDQVVQVNNITVNDSTLVARKPQP